MGPRGGTGGTAGGRDTFPAAGDHGCAAPPVRLGTRAQVAPLAHVPRCSWGLDRTSAGARGAGVSWRVPGDALILLPLQREAQRSGDTGQKAVPLSAAGPGGRGTVLVAGTPCDRGGSGEGARTGRVGWGVCTAVTITRPGIIWT